MLIKYKKKQVQLLKENAKRSWEYYRLTSKKNRLKTLLEYDLLKAKTDYNNAQISLDEAGQNYLASQLTLKLQLKTDLDISVTDSLESLQNNGELTYYYTNTGGRSDVKQIILAQQSNNLKLRKTTFAWLPTLSVVGNYTTQFQSSNFDYSQKLWSPFNSLGVKANLPLTLLVKQYTNAKEYQLKAKQFDLQYRQKKADIDYEIDKNTVE